MEWKKKFYDIVRETETNLIKARRKLYGHGTTGGLEETWPQELYRLKPFSSVTALHSNPAPVSWSPSPWKDQISPARHQLELHPAPASGHGNWEVRSLLDKIDAQNQVIYKMERLVRSLDKEREEYKRQIQELQSEVGGIMSHLNVSRTSDLQMETQVDLMKREVMGEIKRLKDMLLEGRSATTYSSLLEKGMAKDIKDIKQNIHDELDRVQQEVYQIKRRLGKLEFDVTTHDSQGEMLDRLEWHLPDSSRRQNLSNEGVHLQRDYSSPLNPVNAVQIEHLRSTVSSLHDKLDRLEGRLASSASPMVTNGLRSSPWRQQISEVPLLGLEDENSSDSTGLDLSADFDGSLSSNNEPLSDELDNIWTSEKVCEPKSSLPAGGKSWKTQTQLQAPASVRVSAKAAEIPKDADLDLDTNDLNFGSPVDLDVSSLDNTFDMKFDDL